MKKTLTTLILAAGLFAAEAPGPVERLSPELRGLLAMEMMEIEKSMKRIFTDIISGDYEAITKEATQIEGSFIFKRKLTDAQRKELKTKIPKAFIKLDMGFHETAGKLANAAEFEERDNVLRLYDEMIGKCVRCHATFATHRFPNFAEE